MAFAVLSMIDVTDITCQAYRAQLHRGSAAEAGLSNHSNGSWNYAIPYCFYPRAHDATRVPKLPDWCCRIHRPMWRTWKPLCNMAPRSALYACPTSKDQPGQFTIVISSWWRGKSNVLISCLYINYLLFPFTLYPQTDFTIAWIH